MVGGGGQLFITDPNAHGHLLVNSVQTLEFKMA